MNKKIQEWLAKEFDNLSVEHPMSIHLDDLLNEKVRKDTIIDVSVQAFITLIEQLKEKRTLTVPMLVIPLHIIGTQLAKEVPRDLAMLVNQLDDEPPSLYLLHPGILMHLEFCEEYKCPLPFELASSTTYKFYAYYREFRYAEALKNQWEFSRCIYIQPNPLFD